MSSNQPTADGQDVVDFLLRQHREAEGLFAQAAAATGEARREPFEQLVRLLAGHETAEEEIVYPAIRSSLPDGDRLAEARLAEESAAKKALADLESTDVSSDEFAGKLEACREMVLAHARLEEREIFPRLRESHSPEELEKMAKGVQAAEAVAPTHPHPRGPESAVGNIVLGPFVAVADRVRDAIRKLGR
ncbi:MAG TPA: hemerythrin domain-containing protein [Acidimicrobiales bacterium]|nr:hemerythrin domain-containing protein [Acidimicrobiales bacterium]